MNSKQDIIICICCILFFGAIGQIIIALYDFASLFGITSLFFSCIISLIVGLYIGKKHNRELSLVDDLTNLPNRLLLIDRIKHALGRYQRYQESFAVIFVDLDGFKKINDTYGHLIGDAILIETAIRLKFVTRPSDTVSRYAGDEFVILLEGIADEEEANHVSDRILVKLREPIEAHGNLICISASIGVAISNQKHNNINTILHAADAALYKAKRAGKSRRYTFKINKDTDALGSLQK